MRNVSYFLTNDEMEFGDKIFQTFESMNNLFCGLVHDMLITSRDWTYYLFPIMLPPSTGKNGTLVLLIACGRTQYVNLSKDTRSYLSNWNIEIVVMEVVVVVEV